MALYIDLEAPYCNKLSQNKNRIVFVLNKSTQIKSSIMLVSKQGLVVRLFLRKSINSLLVSASDSGGHFSELCSQSDNRTQTQSAHLLDALSVYTGTFRQDPDSEQLAVTVFDSFSLLQQ